MITFFTTEIANFRDLEFITVKSNALKKRADITVFNPSKNNIEAKSLPIVILLHGVYGSNWAWAMKGKVHETALRLVTEGKIKPMVLAMPSDGLFGDGSGYLPHKTENYEKWIVEDVIEVMKEQYTQITDESPIFITVYPWAAMVHCGWEQNTLNFSELFRDYRPSRILNNWSRLSLILNL